MKIYKLICLAAFFIGNILTTQAQSSLTQEKEQIRTWRQNNPQVKIFDAKKYATLPAQDKRALDAVPFKIVFTGEGLRLQDIQNYEQNLDPQVVDQYFANRWLVLNNKVKVISLAKYKALSADNKTRFDSLADKIIYSGEYLTMNEIEAYQKGKK